MIDIHPPHHGAMTRRDIFTHLAIVVAGILIAVGMEQTVEFFHHRYQLNEARKALAVERRVNIVYFAAQTAEFHRIGPILQGDLAVLQYLKDHPHATPDTWPAKFSLTNIIYPYHDAAWHSAQNVLEMMPGPERDEDTDLYSRLANLVQANLDERAANTAISNCFISFPKLEELSPAQIDRMTDLLVDALAKLRVSAGLQRNLTANHPDFTPSLTFAEQDSVLRTTEVTGRAAEVPGIMEKVRVQAKAAGDNQQ